MRHSLMLYDLLFMTRHQTDLYNEWDGKWETRQQSNPIRTWNIMQRDVLQDVTLFLCIIRHYTTKKSEAGNISPCILDVGTWWRRVPWERASCTYLIGCWMAPGYLSAVEEEKIITPCKNRIPTTRSFSPKPGHYADLRCPSSLDRSLIKENLKRQMPILMNWFLYNLQPSELRNFELLQCYKTQCSFFSFLVSHIANTGWDKNSSFV